jgi:methylase of polypeptide subunit release factors
VPQAASRLVGNGALIIEISPMLEQRVVEHLQQDGRFEDPSVVKDLSGLSRVVVARRRGA